MCTFFHICLSHKCNFSMVNVLVLNPIIKLTWHRQNSSEREVLRVKQLFIQEVGVSFLVFFLPSNLFQ